MDSVYTIKNENQMIYENRVFIASIIDGVIKPRITKKIPFDRETEYFWGTEKVATLKNGDEYVVLEAKNGFQGRAFLNPSDIELAMFVYRILPD